MEVLLKNHNDKFIQSLYVFYFSANGIHYYENPPTFKSDSNYATLKFTSNNDRSGTGILMAYVLGKHLYF